MDGSVVRFARGLYCIPNGIRWFGCGKNNLARCVGIRHCSYSLVVIWRMAINALLIYIMRRGYFAVMQRFVGVPPCS